MRSVTAAEANRRFSALLRDVAAGETVIVTSHGRPVAKLAPLAEPEENRRSDDERERRRKDWDLMEARLRSQPALNLGRIDRDSLYDRDP